MRRLDMSKVKEILRLKFDAGLSLRDIAASCNCGKSTVDDVAYFGDIRTLNSETSGQHTGIIRTTYRKHPDTLPG